MDGRVNPRIKSWIKSGDGHDDLSRPRINKTTGNAIKGRVALDKKGALDSRSFRLESDLTWGHEASHLPPALNSQIAGEVTITAGHSQWSAE